MLPILLLAAASGVYAAQSSIRLRVSATIPPRPCEYTQRCEHEAYSGTSMVLIAGHSVRYVGSTPAVTANDDLLTVIF